MALEEYNNKRNFKSTAEPIGKLDTNSGQLRFVIQLHQATRLHYDFRLEINGVLKSWAIPKGPPINTKEKHLAMMVEDHPFEYRNFEGNIPEGNYGAGTVMIWDEGTFHIPTSSNRSIVEKQVSEEIQKGSIKIVLDGKKLKGQFALVRFPKAGPNAWLIIKDHDEYERKEILDSDKSARTGRSLDQISEEKSKGVNKNIDEDKKDITDKINETKSDLKANTNKIEEKKQLLKNNISHRIKPMLSTLIDKPFDNKDFLYEVKWDGYRAIAEVLDKKVKLYSRNNINFNDKYKKVVDELNKIKHNFILDGEVVVVDEKGRSSFELLQNYNILNEQYTLLYYVFDLLYLDGNDLRNLPLIERKDLLKKLILKNSIIKYSEHFDKGITLFELTKKEEIEGVIAKRRESIYQEGVRGLDWLKVKNIKEEEVLIGGYTLPDRTRKEFGSLLVGVFKDNKFQYMGNVGSGFNDSDLKIIKEKLDKYVIKDSPFSNLKDLKNISKWIEPKLIAQIKYSEITSRNIFRQPIFLGLKEDKKASEVVLEEAKKIKKGKIQEQVLVTHTDKIYWPEDNITKGDLIEYYEKISKIMLPYLKDRPENLNRQPSGINGEGFYQKDINFKHPSFAETHEIEVESENRMDSYLICNNKNTLIYMANLGCIEINPWNSTLSDLDHPSYLLFDLDFEKPSNKHDFNPDEFKKVVEVALLLHELLDKLKVTNICKTSGKRGLHIHVPLKEKYSFEQAQSFSKLIGLTLEKQYPDLISMERKPSERIGKVYIDYLQNRKGQTTATAYSVRPVKGAPVSTPLLWSEVNDKLNPKDFTIKTIFKRIDKVGDIWKAVLKKGIDMDKAIDRLAKLEKA